VEAAQRALSKALELSVPYLTGVSLQPGVLNQFALDNDHLSVPYLTGVSLQPGKGDLCEWAWDTFQFPI